MFPAPSVTEKIGNYSVIRPLGEAGPVNVYLALGEAPDGSPRLCELKVVPRIEGDSDAVAEVLQREGAVLARLQHRAIASMVDLFEDEEGRLVLVIEYVDGGTLQQLLTSCETRRHRLADEAVWFIGHEVASALAHAHEAADEDGTLTPVIHRNLRPDNVLVSLGGHVRLTGFALSKVLGRSPDTAYGLVKGAPGYMAPEQLRGERVTPRTDVYGLGILLWTMLTGRRPPMTGPVPESLAFARPDLPPGLAAAIDLALEPDPGRRKITCTEIEQWIASETAVLKGREALREEVRAWRNAVAEQASASSLVTVTPTPGATVAAIAAVVSPRASAPREPSPTSPLPLAIEMDEAIDPSPRAAFDEPRPLSALESVGLAALTAGLVITAGIFIAERDMEVPTKSAAASAAVVTSSASVAPAQASAPKRVVRPPSPRTSAAPDPKKLAAGMGYLTVASPGAATVFVNGAAVGDVNTPLEVACGRRFIRLGTSPDGGAVTTWLAPGQTVEIPCQGALRTEIVPVTTAPPPPGIVSR